MLSSPQQDMLRRMACSTETPSAGAGWRDPSLVWERIVGQICAIGSSRSWEALSAAEVREALRPGRLRMLGPEAIGEVHRVLAVAKVRYCSPAQEISAKAKAIVDAVWNSMVVDSAGEVVLLANLRAEVGEPGPSGVFLPGQARAARRLLVQGVSFLGPKSASDFLLGLGLADSLLAFDVRLLNLLINRLGWDPAWRRRVSRLAAYEALEEEVLKEIAAPLGISGLLLDRTLFQHYHDLLGHWGPNPRDPADGSKTGTK